MSIPTFWYNILSLLASLSSSIALVLAALQMYGDENYTRNSPLYGEHIDSPIIPIIAYVIVGLLLLTFNVLANGIFICAFRSKKRARIELTFGFQKNERVISLIITLFGYMLIILLISDYIVSFYKFYVFDFLFRILLSLTILIYANSASNLISTKKIAKEA